jgi:hypothetical protein
MVVDAGLDIGNAFDNVPDVWLKQDATSKGRMNV